MTALSGAWLRLIEGKTRRDKRLQWSLLFGVAWLSGWAMHAILT